MDVLLAVTLVAQPILSAFTPPWLAERHGEDYGRCCREVPRFLGARAFRSAA